MRELGGSAGLWRGTGHHLCCHCGRGDRRLQLLADRRWTLISNTLRGMGSVALSALGHRRPAMRRRCYGKDLPRIP